MGKREEQLPLSEELVKQFIEINQKQWPKIQHTEQYVFINFSMVRMQMGWILPKLLYAKGIEMSAKVRPVVLTWRENYLLTELIESFGMKHISLDKMNHTDYLSAMKAGMKTLGFMIFDGTGEGLKKVRACGILAGKSLYEDMIRTSALSTIKSARNKICLKKMCHILWTTYMLDRLCKKYQPAYVVCDDIAYHENLFIKLFRKNGARIYNTSPVGEEKIIFEEDGEIRKRGIRSGMLIHQYIDKVDESAVLWSEQYLRERYEGKNGRNIDKGAFAGKKVLSRETVIREQGLDPHKKNVVIMAHTFTDAVFNYGDLYFRDYYDWTEQTLKLAGENTAVNWILKPHPTRKSYNESEDSIEDMYERYKKPNIFFLPDDVSAESIRNIADVLVTIGGNAGAEFACEGIPAVIVGKPYYAGFGYTVEPKTREEYEECLRNIHEIEKLDSEQIKMAKKVFYLKNSGKMKIETAKYSDEFAILVNNAYNQMQEEMPLQYFKSNDGTKSYNDALLKQIMEYFKTHDMKECEYYQRGFLRGKDERRISDGR